MTQANDIHIAAMTSADVKRVAQMHMRAFPEFFLSKLGVSFLRQFYSGFLNSPSAVAIVARDSGGQPLAAAVGTTTPQRFFRKLLTRRLLGFVTASLLAVLRDPRVTPRLLRAVAYRGDAPGGRGALLSSICVDPSAQAMGLGRRVLAAWMNAVRVEGASAAFLTTDADDNQTALTFYSRMGWEVDGTYTTPEGRDMIRYRISLVATDNS